MGQAAVGTAVRAGPFLFIVSVAASCRLSDSARGLNIDHPQGGHTEQRVLVIGLTIFVIPATASPPSLRRRSRVRHQHPPARPCVIVAYPRSTRWQLRGWPEHLRYLCMHVFVHR